MECGGTFALMTSKFSTSRQNQTASAIPDTAIDIMVAGNFPIHATTKVIILKDIGFPKSGIYGQCSATCTTKKGNVEQTFFLTHRHVPIAPTHST